MDTIIDFLLEYYVWILVVLIILVITIIGFLVDTNRKKKLRKKVESEGNSNNMNNINNMGMINDPNMFNNPNMNLNMNMNQGMDNGLNSSFAPPTDFNNNMMGNNMMSQNLNANLNQMAAKSGNEMLQNNMNNGLDNTNNNNNNDTFFTSVSDQTPHFEPREVNIPTPVVPTPIIGSEQNMAFGINNPIAEPPKPVVEPTPVPNVVPPINISPAVQVGAEGNMMGIGGVEPVVPPFNVTPTMAPSLNEVPNANYTGVVPGTANDSVNLNTQAQVVPQITPETSNYPGVNPEINNGYTNVATSTPIMPQPALEPSSYNSSIIPGTTEQAVNVASYNQATQAPLIQPGFVNDAQGNGQMNNTVNQVPNNNFVAGGSTFVVGNPQPNSGIANPNNSNWNV